MSAVGPWEDADSSQIHLLKGHIPPYSSSTPYNGRDIADEQEYITSNEGPNTEPLDNNCQLDSLSQAPSATGITIRKAYTYSRKLKVEDSAEFEGRESVLWVWRLELLLLCVAAGLFAAICLVLCKYHREELPDWNLLGLTLNTLISILGTFFRAIVAVITFEILAQRKWTWLSQDTFRPLRDVELFDSASRGVFRCLRLLPLVATREPVALGAAAIAILSLGIGSFTQQSIQTYQCLREINSQNATVAVANTIYQKDVKKTGSQWKFNAKMQNAIRDAMISPNDASSLFNCSSGNCTFDTYPDHHGNGNYMSHASLGVCNACTDLYDLVEQQRDPERRDNRNYSLPVEGLAGESMTIILNDSGSTYHNVASGMNLSWIDQVATTGFLNHARRSITNVTLIGISTDRCHKQPDGNMTCPNACDSKSDRNRICDDYPGPDTVDYAAAACILYPCVRYYHAQFKNSKPEERVIREVPLRKQVSDFNLEEPLWSAASGTPLSDWKAPIPNPTQLVFHDAHWDDEDIRSPSMGINLTAPADCVVMLTSTLITAFGQEFQDIFNLNCTYGWDDSCKTNLPQSPAVDIYESPLIKDGYLSLQHLNKTMESITTRITNEMRKLGRGAFSDAQPLVKGMAWGSRICVRIARKWLVLPATLLIVSSLLLVLAMLRDTKRRNVWKSSILPMLLKDHPGVERMGLKDLEKTAGGLEVKIQN